MLSWTGVQVGSLTRLAGVLADSGSSAEVISALVSLHDLSTCFGISIVRQLGLQEAESKNSQSS